jgi:adenosylcobinamide-phosphate synthase
MRPRPLIAAYLLDWLIGDPENLPHPVRIFGTLITKAEKLLRRTQAAPGYDLAVGGLLAVGLPLATALVISQGLKLAARRQRLLADGIEILLAATCLATRNLLQEAQVVIIALESGDLVTARGRLARIVGRDTDALEESEISRAVIETLAESLSDGIIARLFYLATAGVPASLAYKSINTMDSMIGHKDERYFYFGKAAARLDDLANFFPSRISALLICAVASCLPETEGGRACKTWLADANKHESPNAGQPESAMAGALGVRLGGRNIYDGQEIRTTPMGINYPPPSLCHARTAIKVTAAASVLGCAVGLLYLWRKGK